jgi:CheY-like chemotaxis protein
LDEAQLEQVVLNLVLNARDAMPSGGQLHITTRELDAEAAGEAGALTRSTGGGRVRLSIEDSGTGMSQEIRDRIFEPFFTTKEHGKGTGLGLASVYGIVQQSGGAIEVETQLGRGTAFHLDFARSPLPQAEPSNRVLVPQVASEQRTVLVVEDEKSVAKLVCRVLENAGFAVLVARDAESAEALALTHPGRIDLLLTDVVMPKVSGRVLADSLCLRFPALRVLFMSGFTDDSLELHTASGSRRFFLQKPFTPEMLKASVCEALLD